MNGIFNSLTIGFGVAFSPLNLLVAALGAFIGTFVGALPGLGPINGVAMLVPIAFAMQLPPETSLILLAAVYVGAEYGGRISSILLNVPGEAAAVMTTLDGHPLARKGFANVALSISAWASFIGSTIAVFGILAFAPFLAKWAIAFGPSEYFVLMVFAFVALTSLLGDHPVKGAVGALIGLAISTVGVDANSGVYRYTFDIPNLSDGIAFIVVVIGLFAVSEMLQMLEKLLAGYTIEVPKSTRKIFSLRELAFTWWATIRAGVSGFIIGILPGAGASIASAVAYANEKKLCESKNQASEFGQGDLRGLVAPESANNAAATGSFIPMLTLGVPGSGTTAVMMGALTLYNITPGPVLFDQQPTIVWGLIASLFIANLMLLFMNIPLVGVFASTLRIAPWILVPAILSISFIGVYALNGTIFDLITVAVIGGVGYFLRKFDVPLAPMVLGVVLGNLMEQNLRRALSISNGDINILFESTICIVLWALIVGVLVIPPILRKWMNAKNAPAN